MLEWIETFISRIETLKDGVITFINQIANIFNNVIEIFPNEMRSYFLITTSILITLIIYNFIWGNK